MRLERRDLGLRSMPAVPLTFACHSKPATGYAHSAGPSAPFKYYAQRLDGRSLVMREPIAL